MPDESDRDVADADSSKRPCATGWVSRLPAWACIGLFFYGTIFVLGQSKDFLVPVVLAFLLAMVFSPVRRFFDRRGVPSALSSLGIILALLVLFLGVASALAVPASNWVHNAPRIERQVQRKIAEISRSMSGVVRAQKKLKKITEPDDSSSKVQKVQVQGDGLAQQLMTLAPSVFAQFIFTFILLLFLLASGDMFYEKLVHVMPTFKDKRRAVRIAYNIERKLSRYLLTIFVINAGLGVAVGLTMWAYGMPSPLVFGVIAFVFNLIPYLGAFAGILIAAVVALLTFDWMAWSAIIAASYFALTSIEGQFITPYFVGRNLRLNTVVVFLTVSFWAWLWSAIGMIVAVPLLVAIKTFCEHIEELDSLGDFLSERYAELEPPSDNGERGRGLDP
ncbi:MAG: AI-2E family transporter [Salinisphaera sp.]|jgi:predicted PurR-regulated permease PerM|nr:AI-2E family transporter [Salinisphaera sp.]